MKYKNKIFIFSFVIILICLLLPLLWAKDYKIEWIKFTEKWYEILFSTLFSSLFVGLIAMLLSDLIIKKINDRNILERIDKQKFICAKILNDIENETNRSNTIRLIECFLMEDIEIRLKKPDYLNAIRYNELIFKEFDYYCKNCSGNFYDNSKDTIKSFCSSFISQ